MHKIILAIMLINSSFVNLLAMNYRTQNLNDTLKAFKKYYKINESLPLHNAVLNNDMNNVRKLSKTNIINLKSTFGITPLMIAAYLCYTKIVKELISKGAYINDQDENGWLPLYFAFFSPINNRADIIKLLLAYSTNPNAAELLPNYNVIDTQNKNGSTLIHICVTKNDIERLQLLIEEKKANINIQDNCGDTPLHLAANKGHIEIVELLLSSGATVNNKNIGGWTPLYLASSNGYNDIVKLLLSDRANTDAQDNSDNTALHVAINKNHKEIVELLLSSKANTDIKGKYGDTPLHLAAGWNNTTIVKLLLSKHADTNIKSEDGSVPLHKAARHANKEMVELLLVHGANRNIRNNFGRKPEDLIGFGGQEIKDFLIGCMLIAKR